MSFWKRLFGGGAGAEEAPAGGGKEIEHNGFSVRATPFKQDGQWQCCGVISKEVDGAVKEHRFIRADRFTALDDAIDISLRKGKQMIDEQGDRVFRE